MHTKAIVRIFVLAVVTSTLSVCVLQAQSTPQSNASPQDAQPSTAERITVMDGDAGPCTILLTVTTEDGKPVYDSTVKVHVAYGIAGIKKLDMEAGTNVNGRVKFVGIPPRVHKAPLIFKATKNQLSGSTSFDPLQKCDSTGTIVLKKAEQ